jgi:lipid-A-disaccharide synthase
LLLLLPGSRARELNEHLPVMVEAAERIAGSRPIRAQIVLPNRDLAQHAQRYVPARLNWRHPAVERHCAAEVAIASSGTVTMECAFFGVPTVVIYKASWSNYWLAKQFLKVKFLAMPNLLANEEVYPEHIQQEATAERIAEETLNLLNDGSRRSAIKTKLRTVVQSLGPPGASFRAAQAIVNLLVE